MKIYDGSVNNETQKVKAMPLKNYFDKQSAGSDSAERPVSGDSIKTLLEEHMQSKTAVSFFCISGTQDQAGKFSFRNTRHTFITKAEGTKADKLNGTPELHNLQATDTVV